MGQVAEQRALLQETEIGLDAAQREREVLRAENADQNKKLERQGVQIREAGERLALLQRELESNKRDMKDQAAAHQV